MCGGRRRYPFYQPAALRRLRELLRALGDPIRNEDDRHAHEQNNSELHQIIIQASGNDRLKEMYRSLHAQIQIVRIHAAEANWAARLEEEQAEHEAIVTALAARDGAALAATLRKHIYRAKDAMIAALKSLGHAAGVPPASRTSRPLRTRESGTA